MNAQQTIERATIVLLGAVVGVAIATGAVWAGANAVGWHINPVAAFLVVVVAAGCILVQGSSDASVHQTPVAVAPTVAPTVVSTPARPRTTWNDVETAIRLYEKGSISKAQLDAVIRQVAPPVPVAPPPPRRRWF